MQETQLDSPGIRKLIPPRIFLLCLLVALSAEILLFDLTLSRILGLALLPLLAGIAVSTAGLFAMSGGLFRFSDAGTSVKTGQPATQLVTGGLYAFSRNPMYVGFVAVLLGPGIALGTVPFLASSLVMFLYLNSYVIPREEAYLKQRFGTVYLDYCARVRRWI